MKSFPFFLGILFFCIGILVHADDSEMKKFYGCYKVLKFRGTGDYKNFKPVTLEISHENYGPYMLPDKRRLGGTQFAFWLSGGGMAFGQTLFSYDTAGYCGKLKKGGDYSFFAGEACDNTQNDGVVCGGHIENIEVMDKDGRLEIKGSRLFNYPFYSYEFRAGLEAMVEPTPLNSNGLCGR